MSSRAAFSFDAASRSAFAARSGSCSSRPRFARSSEAALKRVTSRNADALNRNAASASDAEGPAGASAAARATASAARATPSKTTETPPFFFGSRVSSRAKVFEVFASVSAKRSRCVHVSRLCSMRVSRLSARRSASAARAAPQTRRRSSARAERAETRARLVVTLPADETFETSAPRATYRSASTTVSVCSSCVKASGDTRRVCESSK